MAHNEFYNIVTLLPYPDKLAQVIQEFKTFASHVHEHEPRTQIYFAVQPKDSGELVLVEK